MMNNLCIWVLQIKDALSTVNCHAGLSFRTTEESLRNAFQNFGQLVEGESIKDFGTFLFLVELD